MATASDQVFVESVVKALVDHPDKVSTDRSVDERGVLITLNIDPQDMGYVIGKRGQNARAIRTLLRLVGARNNSFVNLKINEPEGSRGPRRSFNNDHNTSDDTDVSVDDLNI